MTAAAVAEWRATQPSMYSLTELTGKKKSNEATTYVASFEVGRRSLWTALIGAVIPGVPLAGLLAWCLAVFGGSQFLYLALVPPMLSAAAAVWLFVGRENRGLRLLRFQGFMDRHAASRTNGRVFIGPVEVAAAELQVLVPVVIDTPLSMLPGQAPAIIPSR